MKYFYLLAFYFFSVIASAQDFETTEVVVEPYSDTLSRSGKLTFKNTLLLSFKTSGYLDKLSVDEGDAFKANQILAAMDTTELRAQKNSTYAQLLQAKREVTRIKQLMAKNLSSQQALDIAETTVETARATYHVAYYNLEKSVINAPFDGVVLNRFTDLGELQAPGKEVLRVAALDKNWVVKVALTGSEIMQVQLNQWVEVVLPNKGVMRGKIIKIPAISNTNGNLFLIDVLLPELTLSSGVIAGQLAEVHIKLSSEKFVYRLPIDALVSVDAAGKAIILTKNESDGELQHQRLDIHKINNQYIYLAAASHNPSLHVVVSGWQHIQIKK